MPTAAIARFDFAVTSWGELPPPTDWNLEDLCLPDDVDL